MPKSPKHEPPSSGAGERADIEPADGALTASHASHGADALAADRAISRLTALQLDAYAQTLRGLHAPTVVVPSAGDEVSALTAARFVAHAQNLQEISARFAAAHEALIRSLAISANLDFPPNPSDSTPTT